MRVLVVAPGPNFSVADVYDGLVKGLQANGCDVMTFNLDDRLNFYSAAHMSDADGNCVHDEDGKPVPAFSEGAAISVAAQGLQAALYTFWPDVVIIVSGFFIPPEMWGILARRPHHVVLWCTESPYEDDRQAQPARYADTVILNDPTNLDGMRSVNKRTFYLPHSYDPDRHHPQQVERTVDFAFVGTGFPSRIEFFEKVDWSGIDAKFGGNWTGLDEGSPLLPLMAHEPDQCMSNTAAASLYRQTRVTANLYRKEASRGAHANGWAIGPREVELAACGSFFLREPRGEGDELFPTLPTFSTPVEFEDLLRWWLAHPAEREKAIDAARLAIADRTFTNTVASLLRIVDGAPTTTR